MMRTIRKFFIVFLALLSGITNLCVSQTQSDSSDAVWSIVVPEPKSHDVDMLQVFVNDIKDSLVTDFVSNIGTWVFRVDSIYFRGADLSCFSIVSGFPQYKILGGASQATEFRFFPNRIGLHQAEIVIITQVDTLVQTIRGEGIAPQLAILEDFIDFGIVEVGEKKDTIQAVTIMNIGTDVVIISNTKHSKPNDYDFSTLSGGGSFPLYPGDTCKMNLRFTPSDVGRTSGLLEFQYSGVGSPAIVQLFGEGIINKPPQISSSLQTIPDATCVSSSKANLTISNIGNKTLTISDIEIYGNNATDFSIPTFTAFDLEPDSSKDLSVIYKPTSIGQSTAELKIISNSFTDSTLIVQLSAQKDSVLIQATVHTIDLGTLLTQATKDTFVVIKNYGSLKTNYKSIATNNIDLSSTNSSIDVNMNDTLAIHFKGLAIAGYINESITITDQICNRNDIINITGLVKDSSSRGLLVSKVSFDDLICDDIAVDTLKITNIGNEPLTVFDAKLSNSSFGFRPVFTQTLIEPDSEKVFVIFFEPLYKGISRDTLRIFSNADPDSVLVFPIEGIKEIVEYITDKSKIEFGNIKLNAPATANFKITNQGTLVNTYLITKNGNVELSESQVTIQSGETATIDVNFIASASAVDIIADITITEKTCNNIVNVTVTGVVFSASAELKTIELSAYAGEDIEIPIILNNQDNLILSGVTAIKTDLSFNHTMLYPKEYSVSKIDTITSKITIDNLSTSSQTGQVLANIKFFTGLGNAEECNLTLSNAETIGGTADITLINGKFTLLGICREGGTRLFDPDAQVILGRIAPNPTTGDFELSINLIESGYTEIYLTNTIGLRVSEIFKGNITEEGEYKYTINTQDISSGVYYITLQTPTVRKLEKIIIDK